MLTNLKREKPSNSCIRLWVRSSFITLFENLFRLFFNNSFKQNSVGNLYLFFPSISFSYLLEKNFLIPSISLSFRTPDCWKSYSQTCIWNCQNKERRSEFGNDTIKGNLWNDNWVGAYLRNWSSSRIRPERVRRIFRGEQENSRARISWTSRTQRSKDVEDSSLDFIHHFLFKFSFQRSLYWVSCKHK